MVFAQPAQKPCIYLMRTSASLRERVEQVDPDAFGRPSDVAIVKRLLGSVFRRRVDPAPTGFEHMNDVADDPAVVDPRITARVRGKMRSDLRKPRVRVKIIGVCFRKP